MPWSMTDILIALPAYALVLARLVGMIMVAPIYASTTMPVRIRVGLAATIAAMIFPLVVGQAPADLRLADAIAGSVSELMIGASIGLALAILLMGGEMAGLIVGRQAGIALGQVFNPAQNTQTTITGQLYTIVLTLVFLAAGGHRATMAAVLDTYRAIPLLGGVAPATIGELLFSMMTVAFVMGIRLAGPVLIALFLTGVTLGVISRTMPQINILSVGFAVRTMVALGMAGLAITASQEVMVNTVWHAFEQIREAIGVDPVATRLAI